MRLLRLLLPWRRRRLLKLHLRLTPRAWRSHLNPNWSCLVAPVVDLLLLLRLRLRLLLWGPRDSLLLGGSIKS